MPPHYNWSMTIPTHLVTKRLTSNLSVEFSFLYRYNENYYLLRTRFPLVTKKDQWQQTVSHLDVQEEVEV
ncbi:hypothetical protein M8J76_000455 [Diaphorina citri]|nr:hypothetical protein M8J76_000455 [Diaphorina citri]